MGKTALVAGGAGFIGSHLCDLLLEKGYQVTSFDNFVTGHERNIRHLKDRPDFTFFEHDITETLPTEHTQGQFDEIYNLASPASPKDFDRIPLFILKTASVGQHQMLKLGQSMNSPVLFCSTSEVYGDPLEHPQKETYFGNVNTLSERACYDEGKRYAEALCMAFRREHGTDIRIARIFNTYGPRMAPRDGRIIPNFFCQALENKPLTVYGDGSQTRSFCYVSDLVEGLYALMQSSETTPVNLGNPIERSVSDMATIVNEMTKNSGGTVFEPLPDADPKVRRPDISKANKCLNWEPKVGLEEGLEKTFQYFRTEFF